MKEPKKHLSLREWLIVLILAIIAMVYSLHALDKLREQYATSAKVSSK